LLGVTFGCFQKQILFKRQRFITTYLETQTAFKTNKWLAMVIQLIVPATGEAEMEGWLESRRLSPALAAQ
jgi:hypothetical protein